MVAPYARMRGAALGEAGVRPALCRNCKQPDQDEAASQDTHHCGCSTSFARKGVGAWPRGGRSYPIELDPLPGEEGFLLSCKQHQGLVMLSAAKNPRLVA